MEWHCHRGSGHFRQAEMFRAARRILRRAYYGRYRLHAPPQSSRPNRRPAVHSRHVVPPLGTRRTRQDHRPHVAATRPLLAGNQSAHTDAPVRTRKVTMMKHEATSKAHDQRMKSRPRADDALVLFAKAPIPGQVKTRLCPPLTDDEAASLHGSFVLDALERSGQAAIRGVAKQAPKFDRFLACSPSSDHVFFKILEERNGVHLINQIGDDLGARMEHTFAEMFRIGYQ